MVDRAVIEATQGRAVGRQGAAVLALMVPAIAGALVLLIAAAGAGRPERSPSRALSPVAFGLAVRADDLDAVFDAIRSGSDPNAPVPYRDPDQTAGREILVAPVMIAIANNRENTAMVLLSHGLRLDQPANAGAICLAEAMKEKGIVDILVRQGPARVPENCPGVPPGTPPLLAFATAPRP